jgi:putative DNA primase/helicase
MYDVDILRGLIKALRAGWVVFPIIKGGKIPADPGGCRDATSDLRRVVNHWRKYPEHNYGIATGTPSGVFVLDIDGPEGEASLLALCAEHGSLRPTVTVITANGRHLYFKANGLIIGNSVGKLGAGIDVRGEGGYVVGAGSVHPTGHVYRYATKLEIG